MKANNLTEKQAKELILNDKPCPNIWIDFHLAKSQGLYVSLIRDNVLCGKDLPEAFDYNYCIPIAVKKKVKIFPSLEKSNMMCVGFQNQKGLSYDKDLLTALKRCIIKSVYGGVV